MHPIGDVIVNGSRMPPAAAAVPVADLALLRGYGCFEALRSYGGAPFRLGEHLDRLESSAAALGIPLPERELIGNWVIDRAALGDTIVRIVVTAGSDLDSLGESASVIVFAHELSPPRATWRLLPLAAPWHAAGRETELVGAKTLSYAPNTAAQLRARAAGFDDALLVAGDKTVLELPMSSIAWVRAGLVETPSLELGILRSVTRGAMLEAAKHAGIDVAEGIYDLDVVAAADEVFIMSTTKEIGPVAALGDDRFEPGPVTNELAAGLRRLIEAEVGAD